MQRATVRTLIAVVCGALVGCGGRATEQTRETVAKESRVPLPAKK